MHPYPHHYAASATGQPDGLITAATEGVALLHSAPPPQFDGPEGQWSPETLLMAALADCFVLTFRAVARGSKFQWISLHCTVEGTLERVAGGSQFTRYVTRATLSLPAGSDQARAAVLLEKAEHSCLIANSLKGERELQLHLNVAG